MKQMDISEVVKAIQSATAATAKGNAVLRKIIGSKESSARDVSEHKREVTAMENENGMNEPSENVVTALQKCFREMSEIFREMGERVRQEGEAMKRNRAKLEEIARRIGEEKGGDDSAASR